MADRPHISLPYGLSEFHRQKRTMGKVTVLPVGGCARWKIPSLEQVANSNTSPTIDVRRNFRHPHKRSKDIFDNRSERLGEERMTGTTPEGRKRKRVPASAERRHSPESISQLQPRRRTKAPMSVSEMDPRKVTRKRPMGPGTRRGASMDVPITIDDDDESSEKEQEAEERQSFFRRSRRISSPTLSFDNIYSPLSRTREVTQGKRGFGSIRGAYAAPPDPVINAIMARAPSIYVG
jgi:hypothetical protein